MGRRRDKSDRRQRAWLAAALLAIVMRVLVPVGFMAAPTQGEAFALVICTGQGPLVVAPSQPDQPDDAPAKGSQHHPPCAFAGHGVALQAPNLLGSEISHPAPAQAAVIIAALAARPGEGLAAPPPPATGPPIRT